MKIPAAKIELATSPQASRYMLQAIKLDIQNQQLVATDTMTMEEAEYILRYLHQQK